MASCIPLSLLGLLATSVVVTGAQGAKSTLTWASCGTGVDCASLEVPLEYAKSSSSSNATASIALARYSATVPSSQRLGSILINPGGPGASGVNWVLAGAGAAISTLSGGLYDIIGWDPRGVGSTTPLLQCFSSAGAEYNFSSVFPASPNLWLGEFSNSSYDAQVQEAIADYDAAAARLADACVAENSPALYTSSSAYVVRDMAAIVDAVDGPGAKLNYWGVSYGTIYIVEFIQTFPERVGRVIADGVFSAKAQAETYASQFPFDQYTVRAALNDLIEFCEAAGEIKCPFSVPPIGIAANLTQRIDKLFEDLFKNPIKTDDFSISLDIFNPFLWNFMLVPVTFSYIATVLEGLEARNETLLLELLGAQAVAPPADPNSPGVGTEKAYPLTCIDNAPSSNITLAEVISLTKSISLSEDTPVLSADLIYITFCRNFPDTRPLVPNLGVSQMALTDTKLEALNTTVLILNGVHDSNTPLIAAQELRSLLPNSSRLATRGGPGHTSFSVASLGLLQTAYNFFVSGVLPEDNIYYNVDQELFPDEDGPVFFIAAPSFNGTGYSSRDLDLLNAAYDVILAFIAIA